MEEKKYPIGGYAPGNYHQRCCICERSFFGDKRAYQCESCAIADKEKFDALSPEEQQALIKRNAGIANYMLSGPLSPERDLIYRIVEQWGNAIEMQNMEGWLKDYADKRSLPGTPSLPPLPEPGELREIIEDILFKTGKHNQEECSELADAIMRNAPKRTYGENEYPDLSSATPESKAETINGLVLVTAREVLKMFLAFGLQTHIECTVVNDPTKEEFDFIFRKKGTAGRVEDAVAFAEWLYKNRWCHFENGRWEYTFEMGSAVSRGEYLKNYIKTSAELYKLFKQNQKS